MNETRPAAVTHPLELAGHLIDSLTLSKVLDLIERGGGDFEVTACHIGRTRRDLSTANITVSAPDEATLRRILTDLEPHLPRYGGDPRSPHLGHDAHYARSPLGSADIPKILMCPPDHFTVDYAINPWMVAGESGKPDVALARRQWDALYTALTQTAGAEVLLMEPAAGLPDLVFTANAAFVHQDRAVIAHYKYPERQGEEPHAERWFRAHGFQVFTLPRGIFFEGAGDALIWQDRVFAGYKTRTEIASHSLITAETGLPVLSLELVDPRFYHIDVCVCPLADGHLLYYPEAFDDYGRSVIAANVPAGKLIPVTAAEAAHFACNAVNVHDTVVFHQGAPRVADELRQRGFNVVPLDLSEFLKSGGSAKCLTLRVG